MRKMLTQIAALCLAVGMAMPVYAQVLHTEDNKVIAANISNTEPTRISVDGDRIVYLRGLESAYSYKNDTVEGAVFITPKENQKSAFNVFITTEAHHSFSLRLTPGNHVANFLVVQLKSIQKAKVAAFEKSMPYSALLAELIKQMARGNASEAYSVFYPVKTKPIYLPGKLKLQLQNAYAGDHLAGAIFVLTNASPYDVSLHESQFYKLEDAAIALKDTFLPAGTSTLLYKVKTRG